MADGSFVENVNQPPTKKEMEGNESQVAVAELSSPKGTEKPPALEGENQKEGDKTSGVAKASLHNSPDPQKQKEREEKLRLAKERHAEDRQRKMGELAEAEKRAEGFRKKQEEEKKKKLDEMRRKEREHRALVEERRRKLMEEENAKRNAILKKNASKDSKGDDKKTKKSSGPYGFGSRAPRMVCSSIDNTKRAVSHGNLLNKQTPINSFDVLDASAPNGGQRIQRRAASACNLKSPRVAAKQGQDRPQTSSSYNRLSVSTSHLARTRPREHNKTATGHAGSLADLSKQGLGAAPGLRRPASSQSEHTLTSNDSSPRRRPRPHSVAGRVPGYASPTIASQIRQGRSQDKKSAEGSVSPLAKGRSKSADTGALRRSRADIRKTFERLSTPKKAPQVKVSLTPRESPKPQTTPKIPATSRSYATPPKPAVPRSLPKESPKQIKASLPASSHRGVTPTKGPLKAVHMNLPSSNKKSRPPPAREESPMKEKKSAEPQPKSEPSKAEPPKAEPAKPPAAAAAAPTAKPAPASTAKPAAAATPKPTPAATPKSAVAATVKPAAAPATAPAVKEKKQEEEDYKAKLAENRRQAREKAEREAEEERMKNEELKRIEEERIRKEEEDERKRIEEELKMAAEARKAEEERLKKAIEAEEKRKQEEEERLEAERKAKEEADRQAQEDRERLEKERQERKKREEEERQERKKRLEMIMKRVKTDDTSPKEETPSPSRGTASSSGTNTPEEAVIETVQTQEPSKEEKPNNVSTQPSTIGAQPKPVDDDAPKFKSPLLQQMLGNKRRTKPANDRSADNKNEEVESDKENKDNEEVPKFDLDVSRSAEEPVKEAEDIVEPSEVTEPAIGSEDVQIGIESAVVDNQAPTVAASEQIRDTEQIVHTEDKLDEQTHVETSATTEQIDNHKEYLGDIRFDADKDVDTLEADTQPLSLSQTASSAETANMLDLSQPLDGASESDKSRAVDSNVVNGFADNQPTDSADSFSKDSVLEKPVQPNGLEYEGAPGDNQFEQLIDLSTVDNKKGPLVATSEDSTSRNLMDSDADLLNSNSQSPLGAPLIAFEDNTTLKQENIPGTATADSVSLSGESFCKQSADDKSAEHMLNDKASKVAPSHGIQSERVEDSIVPSFNGEPQQTALASYSEQEAYAFESVGLDLQDKGEPILTSTPDISNDDIDTSQLVDDIEHRETSTPMAGAETLQPEVSQDVGPSGQVRDVVSSNLAMETDSFDTGLHDDRVIGATAPERKPDDSEKLLDKSGSLVQVKPVSYANAEDESTFTSGLDSGHLFDKDEATLPVHGDRPVCGSHEQEEIDKIEYGIRPSGDGEDSTISDKSDHKEVSRGGKERVESGTVDIAYSLEMKPPVHSDEYFEEVGDIPNLSPIVTGHRDYSYGSGLVRQITSESLDVHMSEDDERIHSLDSEYFQNYATSDDCNRTDEAVSGDVICKRPETGEWLNGNVEPETSVAPTLVTGVRPEYSSEPHSTTRSIDTQRAIIPESSHPANHTISLAESDVIVDRPLTRQQVASVSTTGDRFDADGVEQKFDTSFSTSSETSVIERKERDDFILTDDSDSYIARSQPDDENRSCDAPERPRSLEGISSKDVVPESSIETRPINDDTVKQPDVSSKEQPDLLPKYQTEDGFYVARKDSSSDSGSSYARSMDDATHRIPAGDLVPPGVEGAAVSEEAGAPMGSAAGPDLLRKYESTDGFYVTRKDSSSESGSDVTSEHIRVYQAAPVAEHVISRADDDSESESDSSVVDGGYAKATVGRDNYSDSGTDSSLVEGDLGEDLKSLGEYKELGETLDRSQDKDSAMATSMVLTAPTADTCDVDEHGTVAETVSDDVIMVPTDVPVTCGAEEAHGSREGGGDLPNGHSVPDNMLMHSPGEPLMHSPGEPRTKVEKHVSFLVDGEAKASPEVTKADRNGTKPEPGTSNKHISDTRGSYDISDDPPTQTVTDSLQSAVPSDSRPCSEGTAVDHCDNIDMSKTRDLSDAHTANTTRDCERRSNNIYDTATEPDIKTAREGEKRQHDDLDGCDPDIDQTKKTGCKQPRLDDHFHTESETIRPAEALGMDMDFDKPDPVNSKFMPERGNLYTDKDVFEEYPELSSGSTSGPDDDYGPELDGLPGSSKTKKKKPARIQTPDTDSDSSLLEETEKDPLLKMKVHPVFHQSSPESTSSESEDEYVTGTVNKRM